MLRKAENTSRENMSTKEVQKKVRKKPKSTKKVEKKVEVRKINNKICMAPIGLRTKCMKCFLQ